MAADLDKSPVGPSNCSPPGKAKDFGIHRLIICRAKSYGQQSSLATVSGWTSHATGSVAPEKTIPIRALFAGTPGAREWLRAPDRLHGRQEKYTLLRCPSCSLVWLCKPPKPAEMHRHYTDAYDRLISAAGENSPDAGGTATPR